MNFLDNIYSLSDRTSVQISITAVLILLFFISRRLNSRIIQNQIKKLEIAPSRGVYVRKTINLVSLIICFTLISLVWDISFRGLSIYFASIFTVLGVALVATWSVLSNITASLILFFFFPYRIGERIKIIDGDNSIEGEITDITLFYIRIKTDDKQIYCYPNNLAIQKPFKQL